MSLPKIIKTTFYVDPSQGRNYQFDVNQNICMNEVKGMLVVASKVAKIGLRIFHKQTEKEYTAYKNETLEELFPGKTHIEFIIKIDRRFRNDNDYDQLKLGEYCKIHPHKYCFFYCFDCEVSLCSLCIGTGAHKNHSITEKFDYLKPSNEIVDTLFSDLDDVVKKVDDMNTNDVEDFRLKLKMNYFPSLIELLRKIEDKMNEQIDYINKHYETNITVIKNNSVKLKEHCTDGLDELKQQIDIENILKDEGVFLHFDYKVKELAGHKTKIFEDTEKAELLLKSYHFAKSKFENIYLEIKTFLQKMLSSTVYDDIKLKTSEVSIKELSKESVLDKLLSEFKKQNGKLISAAKPIKDGNLFASIINSSTFNDIQKSDGKRAYPLSNTYANIESTDHKDKTKSFVADNTQISFSNTKKFSDDDVCLMKVSEGSNKVIVFSHNKSGEETITDRFLNINPKIHGCSNFLNNCAIVNTGKKIYISGGETPESMPSNIFLCYDPLAHHLTRLDDMPVEKFNHSLILSGDFIYSIGGYDSNSCERYDIKQNKWIKLPSLKSGERQRPILNVNGSWLYVFFGYRRGAFLDTIERINLKSSKAKFESVIYLNPDKENCSFIGAACISSEDGLYLIGGKDDKSIRSNALLYTFEENKISKCEIYLEEEGYFKENEFIKLKSGEIGLFNENANQLLKLRFS